MLQHVVLRRIEPPFEDDVRKDLSWLCNSFGLSSGRDTGDVAIQIIRALLENHAGRQGVPVEEISMDLGITPSRVNHHIRNLVENGIIFRQKREIRLRGSSLLSSVREIRKDADRIFDELEMVAAVIDGYYGLRNR
jgi:predicted transcriptional regulator